MTRPSPPRSAQALATPPFRILRPAGQTAAMVVASPHSGCRYPPHFLAASRLDAHNLRRSEDCFVDELLADAPSLGVPLLVADFPRAFCDVNREPWELDQAMFEDKLPPWCNTQTARISAGFGTIARLVGSGQPIYADKLFFAEAEERVRSCWQPYHQALAQLIAETETRFGCCTLLDVHSMPSEPAAPGRRREPDFVLGDAHGTSCDQDLSQRAHRFLEGAGYQVRRNDPYAGGYVTRQYGRPHRRVHALQIEISRALYMNQADYTRLPGFASVRTVLSGLLSELGSVSPA